MMVPANTVGQRGSVSYCPICRRWGDHELKAIEIVRYKNLKNVVVNLKRMNVFVGEPGSGKSAILETFALWQLFVARQTLSDDLVLRLRDWRE